MVGSQIVASPRRPEGRRAFDRNRKIQNLAILKKFLGVGSGVKFRVFKAFGLRVFGPFLAILAKKWGFWGFFSIFGPFFGGHSGVGPIWGKFWVISLILALHRGNLELILKAVAAGGSGPTWTLHFRGFLTLSGRKFQLDRGSGFLSFLAHFGVLRGPFLGPDRLAAITFWFFFGFRKNPNLPEARGFWLFFGLLAQKPSP